MSSSDFTEVVLDSDGPLSRDVLSSSILLCDGFESMAIGDSLRGADRIQLPFNSVEPGEKRSSPLQQWCERPLVESSGAGKQFEPSETLATLFSINEVMPHVVLALDTTDVVCLIAPTGSGKSLLAPFLAEQLAQHLDFDADLLDYRKTLLVAPNAEHAGSTARCFEKLFGDSGIRVSAYLNPYEERQCWKTNGIGRRFPSSPEFIITTYNAAIRVLPHAKLNLLILDEVHEPNDNVQVTMAMALKMLLASSFTSGGQTTARSLNKLLLMTATLDEKEIKNYKKYFNSHGLSFMVLDFTDILQRRKELKMTCLYTRDDHRRGIWPDEFDYTQMGDLLADEFENKGYGDSDDLDRNGDKLHNRMRDLLNAMMGRAIEDLLKRLNRGTGDYNMQSIIVILPGHDQVDRMYSTSFKLPNFEMNGKAAFHPVRLTSLVKDDNLITTECSQTGHWKPGGHLGRIVFTTNLVAAGLTVPNAAYVIDSGLQKMLREYTKDGLKSLETMSIDRLQIIQRAGRTGRTTDGEYFLPYSAEKVDAMMKKDHGDLLFNRNFEERHFLYKELYQLKLLHEPSERLRRELQTSMQIRGLYSENGTFPKDVVLMNSLFNFLPTELARIVIQGTQLGIAAHVILLVAECTSRVKFCRVGMPGSYYGPSDVKSAVHLYCEAMDEQHAYWHGDQNRLRYLPKKYRGVGDSIALADLLASFYSIAPTKLSRVSLDDVPVEDCNFWGGVNKDGSRNTLADLYPAFVKDEGRDAVSRTFSQIESALKAIGLVSSSTARTPAVDCYNDGIFDPRLNRHVVNRANFCLNEDGRALLSALLTMHSSRVGLQSWRAQQAEYKIYRDRPDGRQFEMLYPDASYTQPKAKSDEEQEVGMSKTARAKARKRAEARRDSEKIYGRYSEMFERRGKYSGLIDPITLKQMTYMLNINGDWTLSCHDYKFSLVIKLNAAPSGQGFEIHMDSPAYYCVTDIRSALKRGLQQLTHTRDENLIANVERLIIKLWRECEPSVELEKMMF